MDILSVCALCICVCIVSQLLNGNVELKIAVVLLCVSVVFIKITGSILQLKDLISGLLDKAGLDGMYLNVIFKGLGICYISQISADCCRDSGQSSLAAQIELAGKLAMIVVAIPLFSSVIELIETILV